MFEGTVSARRDAVALRFAEHSCTFGELRSEALQCATWLSSVAVGRGDVVALQLPKRRSTFVLWLACIRQGAIYVFVDPANPEARTARIVDTVRPALIAASASVANPFGASVQLGDSGPTPWHKHRPDAAPVAPPLHGLSPAYIMFTSGSTGEPKGAVIPHQGVISLMRWVHNWVPNPAAECFSNLNPLHFDNSVFDLYCGLLNGATLVPVETAASHNPMLWVRRLRDGNATVAFAVPTLFQTLARLRLLTPGSLPSVRVFLFGGEGFPTEALRAFHSDFSGHARLINVYGPTETSCICSSLLVDNGALEGAGDGLVSLGRMHQDFDWSVLDDQGQAVPVGATGELWIGGSNVGLGYFSNPQETSRRFQQDPRQSHYRSLWYRSGDLVREDAAGLLWFQGRADNQVKIRGHRIELEEIDYALEAIPKVTRAVAAVVAGADGPEIRAAFLAETPLIVEDVRALLKDRLPAYMQPAVVVQMDSLPQNANGKVDRRATSRLLQETR